MTGRPWTDVEVRYLRDQAGRLSHAQIGKTLGRTRKSVNSYAKAHGILSRRPWTEADLAFLRRWEGKRTAAWVAGEMGRTTTSVHQARARLSLNRRRCPKGKPFEVFILQQHALGWSDSEIAAAWSQRFAACVPINRHTIGERRAKLGLADNSFSKHRRRRVAIKTAEQLRKAGLPSIGHLRVEAFKKRAREAGWPEDLRPRAVQILNAMWDKGPMTRRELADAIGMPWKGSRPSLHSNDPEGSYLAHLMARGLVVDLGRVVRRPVAGPRGGQGKNVHLYSLSPFIERKQVQHVERDHQVGKRGRATAGVAGGDPRVGGVGHEAGTAGEDLRQTG